MGEKDKTELYLFSLFKHEHKWSEVDEKGYQTCSKCDKKKLIGVGKCRHQWEEKEERRLVCSICGDVKEIECSHEWTYEAKNKQKCSKCGAIEVVECDHEWEDVEGERFQRCSKCGDRMTYECAHDWDDVDTNTQKCTICGEKREIECSHIYGEPQVDGYQYCTKCNVAKVIEPKCDHEYKKIETLVNSDSDHGKGVKYNIFVYECLKCGSAKAVKVDYAKL